MSIEMLEVIQADQAIVKENGEYDYVENSDDADLLPSGTNIDNSLDELVANNDDNTDVAH